MRRRLGAGMRPGPLGPAIAVLYAVVLIGSSADAFHPAVTDRGPELTLVVTRSSIEYLRNGHPIPVGAASSPVRLGVSVTSSGPVEIRFAGSDFSGPAPLPADARLVRLGHASGGLRPARGSDRGWNPTSEAMAWNPIYSSERAVRDAAFELTLRVRVPADALAGVYTGAIELTATQPVVSTADPSGPIAQEGGATADPTPGNVRPGD